MQIFEKNFYHYLESRTTLIVAYNLGNHATRLSIFKAMYGPSHERACLISHNILMVRTATTLKLIRLKKINKFCLHLYLETIQQIPTSKAKT